VTTFKKLLYRVVTPVGGLTADDADSFSKETILLTRRHDDRIWDVDVMPSTFRQHSSGILILVVDSFYCKAKL
jgi:hypothetical protein